MVKSLNLKKDDPGVIAPPAPCISYSGTDWGINVHLVSFGTCRVCFLGLCVCAKNNTCLYVATASILGVEDNASIVATCRKVS